MGFLDGINGANAGDIRDVFLITASGRSPGGEHSPVFMPGESHGQKSSGLWTIGSQRTGHD